MISSEETAILAWGDCVRSGEGLRKGGVRSAGWLRPLGITRCARGSLRIDGTDAFRPKVRSPGERGGPDACSALLFLAEFSILAKSARNESDHSFGEKQGEVAHQLERVRVFGAPIPAVPHRLAPIRDLDLRTERANKTQVAFIHFNFLRRKLGEIRSHSGTVGTRRLLCTVCSRSGRLDPS